MSSEGKIEKLMALIDEVAEQDPDRAARFIESVLARHALRKRLADKRATQQAAEPAGEQTRPLGYLPKWAVDRLTGDQGKVADPLVWGLYTHVYLGQVDHGVAIYTQAPTQQPLTDEQEREAFETYVTNTPLGSYSTDRRGDGKYWSSHTQLMWDAWKARAAHGITSKEGGAA